MTAAVDATFADAAGENARPAPLAELTPSTPRGASGSLGSTERGGGGTTSIYDDTWSKDKGNIFLVESFVRCMH